MKLWMVYLGLESLISFRVGNSASEVSEDLDIIFKECLVLGLCKYRVSIFLNKFCVLGILFAYFSLGFG